MAMVRAPSAGGIGEIGQGSALCTEMGGIRGCHLPKRVGRVAGHRDEVGDAIERRRRRLETWRLLDDRVGVRTAETEGAYAGNAPPAGSAPRNERRGNDQWRSVE